MTSVESFVSELEGKNQTSFERLLTHRNATIDAENLQLVDLLALEVKSVIEATEAAAMWLTDTQELDYKMALAAYCGACAQRHSLLAGRMETLGWPKTAFDPLALGYSKLFAFFRSLQTTAERAAAGALTAGAYALVRFETMAGRAEALGDPETAALCQSAIPPTELDHVHEGRVALLAHARTEESQARARRASFRTIELMGEIQEATFVKKFLSRARRTPANT